jgi:hypothetical protein
MITHSISERGITFYFEDFNGHQSQHSLRFLATETTAGLKAYAESYIPRLRAVSDAGIIQYNITSRLWIADPDPASAGSDMTDCCTVLMNNAAIGLNQIQIPSINLAMMTGDPRALDQTAIAVQAYLSDLAAFCNDHGEMNTTLHSSLYEKLGQFR